MKDIVKYLRQRGMVPAGAFRMSANATVNQNVLGAWIRLCQLAGSDNAISTKSDKKYSNELINVIKSVMCQNDADLQRDLKSVMEKYGIDFSVVRNFRGASVREAYSLQRRTTRLKYQKPTDFVKGHIP